MSKTIIEKRYEEKIQELAALIGQREAFLQLHRDNIIKCTDTDLYNIMQDIELFRSQLEFLSDKRP